MKNIFNFIKRKRLILIFAAIILFVALASVFTQNTFQLLVNVIPEGATITINEKERFNANLKRRFPPGEYRVKAEKEGYQPYEQSIKLDKDTQIDINLETAVAEVTQNLEVSPLNLNGRQNISSITSQNQNLLIGVDPSNESLILYTENGFRTILDKPVHSYSVVYPFVSVIEKGKNNQITLINLQSGSTTELTNVSSVIATAISDDAKILYFLGEYNPNTRKSVVYESEISNFEPTRLTTTDAVEINTLLNNNLLLYTHGESLDGSKVSILDTNRKAIIKSYPVNKYSLSLNKNYLAAILSSQVSIVNMESLTQVATNLKYDSLFTWKDDKTLLAVENLDPGVVFQYFDVEKSATSSLTRVSSLQNSFIRTVYGVFNGKLIARTADNKVIEVDLP